MADYRTKFDLDAAYALDALVLKDLFEVCRNFLEGDSDLTIKLEFSGGHEVEANSATDVLADSLVRTHPIRKLTIEGTNYQGELRRTLRLGMPSFRHVFEFDVSGPRGPCSQVRSEMENLLQAHRQWYWPFSLNDRGRGFVVFMGIVVMLGAIVFGAGSLAVKIAHAPALVAAGVGMVVAVPLIAGAMWLNIQMFPQLVFRVGRSTDLEARAVALRRFIFGGVVFTSVVGIAASLVANALSK
jgi:hypothetical protein